MLTLTRKRINLTSPIFTQNPNPTPIRHYATASALLSTYSNRTDRTRHALDGLVTRLLKKRCTKYALRVHYIMSTTNFGTSTSTFNPIIKWLTTESLNDIDAAWLVISAMRASNVEPDSATYNYMVRAYLFEKTKTNVADELLRIMGEKGMRPDGQTNHELVLRTLGTRKVEVAVDLVKRKLGEGEVVMYVTHCVVLRVMLGCRVLGKAVEYVGMVCETDKAMGGRVFSFLARKLGSKGRNGDAGVVLGEMVKRGLPVVGKKLSDLALLGEQKAT